MCYFLLQSGVHEFYIDPAQGLGDFLMTLVLLIEEANQYTPHEEKSG
jgi:hypothetical protein